MLLSGGLPTSSMPRVRVDSAGAARRRDGSLQVEHVAPRRVSATHHTRRPRLASRWHVTCSLGGGHSTANAGKAGVRGGVSKGDVETNARATSTPRGVRRDTASASATDVEEREQEVEVIGGAKAARASADRCEGPLAEHHRTLTLSQRLMFPKGNASCLAQRALRPGSEAGQWRDAGGGSVRLCPNTQL
jgi:hypothetical protein